MAHHHSPTWSDQVRIPVRLINGHWEFFYGGSVHVKEGAMATLTVDMDQIKDSEFLKTLTSTVYVKVLDEKSQLLVFLSVEKSQGIPRCLERKLDHLEIPAGANMVQYIQLGALQPQMLKGPKREDPKAFTDTGGLWLKVKGYDKTELISSEIIMPAESTIERAISLNHAYTLLSEKYETHRKSHTGNVYSRIFYQDSDEMWHPLSDLRSNALAGIERLKIQEAWEKLGEKLSWYQQNKKEKKHSPKN